MIGAQPAHVTALVLIAVGVLPGAALFRIPLLGRELRAALSAEERAFWQVLLSIVWSLGVTLTLGALSVYSLPRLLAVNVGLVAVLLAVWQGRLLFRGSAARPTASLLLPIVLIGLGAWRFSPAAEYIVGGKDPGIYVNEGINLHRTGTLFRRDAVVATVPPAARDLFFTDYAPTEYYGLRFMGVYLNDPTTGEVIPQFPHLFPASIALGYGAAGIRGATTTVGVWALLGLVAVYLFGARLVGRAPAFFACTLLALNVIEVWYGRYPNAEVVMQTLLFGTLLAFSRALQARDRYFAWVAAALVASLIFLRFDAYLAVAGLAAAAALLWIIDRRALGWGPTLLVVLASVLAWRYYSGPMRAYFYQYQLNLPSPAIGLLLIVAALAATLALGTQRDRISPWLKSLVPLALSAALIGLAVYALFFRQPGGRLNDWNAYSLRTLRDAYVFWPALIAGLVGFALLSRRRFWQEPAFFLVMAGFNVFFFYKIRVVAEHFWMARRFLPVILPGLLLVAAAAAIGVVDKGERRNGLRSVAGFLLLAFIGWQYATAAAPVAAHVEYKGAIRHIEKLAALTTDRDLVLFESRNAESDMHVFAVPLAYIYGRNVLVVESPRPDRRQLEAFLEHARSRYDRVLFIASAGTDLLSRRIIATPLAFVPVTLPEYATAAWDSYPDGPRTKDLGYSVYQLTLGANRPGGFALDVGYLDEPYVLRFRARETTEGRTFRWTGVQSFIAVTGLAGSERELTLVMHDGGRPATAPPASVDLFFNNVPLGTLRVEHGFREYRVALPPDAVRAAAESADPAELTLRSTVWSPSDFPGGTDARALGVMIDRVEIH